MGETELMQEEKLAPYRTQCHYLSKLNSNKNEGFPFYPNFDYKQIPVDPPSVYYQRKLRYKPPPEKEYIRKTVPHKVDPEKLSEDHKLFAGKSLFEKDLIIIEQRNQMLAKNRNYRPMKSNHNKKRAQSVNLQSKKKIISDSNFNIEEEEEYGSDDFENSHPQTSINPPSVFYREEEKRQIKKTERDKQIDLTEKRQKRQEIRRRHKFEKEKKKIDMVTKERESERAFQEKRMIEEKEKELQKKKEMYQKFKQAPLKSTRATNLRTEATNHKIEADNANQQREKLNSKLKAQRLRKQTKRISRLIQSMNQDYNDACRARQMVEEMKKTERGWYRWLDKTQKSNEKKETMLERTLFATD